MSENREEKLGAFLQEVSNWHWDKFVRAEKDNRFTTNEAIIFTLIRACAMEKIEAIRMSINRLDGKLKTPIKIEYPKIFYLYPNATLPEPATADAPLLEAPTGEPEVLTGEIMVIPEPEPEPEEDLPSMSFRQTLTKMSDYPRELPEAILEAAQVVEQSVRGQGGMPFEIPRVKSVVAAHLLMMARNRNIDALAEVFDQIDGKLTETLQIIGDDLFITSYLETAPPGATLNKNGVLQIEATQAQNMWTEKLSRGIK